MIKYEINCVCLCGVWGEATNLRKHVAIITCTKFRRNNPAERDGSSEKTVTAQGEETVRNTIATIRIPNSALMVAIAAMAERGELSQQWPHA